MTTKAQRLLEMLPTMTPRIMPSGSRSGLILPSTSRRVPSTYNPIPQLPTRTRRVPSTYNPIPKLPSSGGSMMSRAQSFLGQAKGALVKRAQANQSAYDKHMAAPRQPSAMFGRAKAFLDKYVPDQRPKYIAAQAKSSPAPLARPLPSNIHIDEPPGPEPRFQPWRGPKSTGNWKETMSRHE